MFMGVNLYIYNSAEIFNAEDVCDKRKYILPVVIPLETMLAVNEFGIDMDEKVTVLAGGLFPSPSAKRNVPAVLNVGAERIVTGNEYTLMLYMFVES